GYGVTLACFCLGYAFGGLCAATIAKRGKAENACLAAVVGPLLQLFGSLRAPGSSGGLGALNLLLLFLLYISAILGCPVGLRMDFALSSISRRWFARTERVYVTASRETIRTFSPWRDPLQARFWLLCALGFWLLGGAALLAAVGDFKWHSGAVEPCLVTGGIC